MSLNTLFAQPLRSRLFSHIGVYKRTISSGIEFGFSRLTSSRRSTLLHNFLTQKPFNSQTGKLINKNRFRLTSMMGLVTISDSIKDALYKSEVIPTVIHDEHFSPKGFLMIQYKDSDKEVTMGNTLKVADTQEKPIVHFTLNLSDDHKKSSVKGGAGGAGQHVDESGSGSDSGASASQISPEDRFTLILTDPDAPTKEDDKWSEFCHCVVRNIKLNEFTLAETSPSKDGKNDIDSFGEKLTTVDLQGEELVPYMGPGPPPKTGLHRYVFLLYKQQRGKQPDAPADRPCWGTGVPGSGATEYAQQYGLDLYAVNFFYAKNEEQ